MTNIANWKITMLLMGKSTISMVIFNSYVTNYQRVNQYKSCILQGRAPEKPSDNLALLKIAMALSLI